MCKELHGLSDRVIAVIAPAVLPGTAGNDFPRTRVPMLSGRIRSAWVPAFAGTTLELQVLLALVTLDVRAPWLRANRFLALPDDGELAVALDLADHHRLVQVVVGRVHHQRVAGRRLVGLAAHRRD